MAYAAITSLMSTIKQSMQVTGCNLQSFYEKLESSRAIMEKSCTISGNHDALTSLETEIIELAGNTEDMVDLESRKLFFGSINLITRIIVSWRLHFSLRSAVERIDFIMKKWMEMNIRNKNSQASTSERALDLENKMIGLENEFEMARDQLASGESELEVVSITGMGGIGKTTLANKLYSDPFIVSRFDIRAKTIVSQEYCARNVILGLLSSLSGNADEFHEHQDNGQLADKLQKLLKGRRYLVIMDDIWTTKAWDDIKLCFPDCDNGSRILLTTRNVEVAEYASLGKPPFQMRLLNFHESWNLLHKKVFEKEGFTPEFELLGRQIAFKCGGLPLAIIVIAGLLSKIGKTLNEWKSVAENVNSVVNIDLDVQCIRVMALSYHHLPHHLKPCFLYFAIFPEDKLIFVDKLVGLWATEGFLKVDEMKSIEEVAGIYLKELIDRSLISIYRLSSDGKIKSCIMHDVIRELCLREAQNVNFVNVIRGKDDQDLVVHSVNSSPENRGRISIQSRKDLTSCHNNEARSVFLFYTYRGFIPEVLHFKLVRVLDLTLLRCYIFPSCMLDLVHLRYLALSLSPEPEESRTYAALSTDIPPAISNLRYLQTFILKVSDLKASNYPFILPSEILEMPLLRHLSLDWNYSYLHDPTMRRLVLNNLQCLSGWSPLNCTPSVFTQIPNVKKLHICGVQLDYELSSKHKLLQNLCYLDQLLELKFQMKMVHNENEKLSQIGHPGLCYWDSPQMLPHLFPPLTFLKSPSNIDPVQRITKRYPPLVLPPPSSFQQNLNLDFSQTSSRYPPLVLPSPSSFPQNLKKLAFSQTSLPWKDLSIVGKLPKLEVLKLAYDACEGMKWEVVEEGFPYLKILQLKSLRIWEWRASSIHFPCLERLFIKSCRCLDTIPQDFSEIITLELIDIRSCGQSVGNSAKQIQEDIQDTYGGSIEVRIS